MLSAEDLADVVWDQLKCAPLKQIKEENGPAPRVKIRKFFSEYEIKRMVGRSKTLRVPRGAILSPLVADWISLERIEVIQE